MSKDAHEARQELDERLVTAIANLEYARLAAETLGLEVVAADLTKLAQRTCWVQDRVRLGTG